jgi:hypothetical protein
LKSEKNSANQNFRAEVPRDAKNALNGGSFLFFFFKLNAKAAGIPKKTKCKCKMQKQMPKATCDEQESTEGTFLKSRLWFSAWVSAAAPLPLVSGAALGQCTTVDHLESPITTNKILIKSNLTKHLHQGLKLVRTNSSNRSTKEQLASATKMKSNCRIFLLWGSAL